MIYLSEEPSTTVRVKEEAAGGGNGGPAARALEGGWRQTAPTQAPSRQSDQKHDQKAAVDGIPLVRERQR